MIDKNHLVRDVGDGFTRALYATYLSYLEPNDFISNITSNRDDRGNFVEMVKTEKSGQFSFFSAHPGVTRGSHYHHTKNEKFLVVSGKAKFSFMHMITKDYHELIVESENPQIVETIPGWAHDITNIGKKEMLVMLWANEIFDKEKPDTFWEEPKNEKKIKVVTVVGTRPEIIRLSRVINALNNNFNHTLVHTGQNYDYELNQIFFNELGVNKPDIFLVSDTSTALTAIGGTLVKIEKVLDKLKPDAFLVLGDTNSCLSAIAAKEKKFQYSIWKREIGLLIRECLKKQIEK